MPSEYHAMKSIIRDVIKINQKYKEIQKLKGENFNIFSILKLERNEVQTHSNFIYELLNPEGSHNQKDRFLKLFLKNVLKLSDDDKTLNVYQEYLTSHNRRIDFVIETEAYQIGIEMKIDAGDQDDQLIDYARELGLKEREPKLYYLTLTGYEASEKSSGKELKYELLSFENDIFHWIEECIQISATIPLLREGLVHYKNLISKITNKISDPMEEEMEEIISTPEQLKAAQTIFNEYPKIWAKKEMEFWDALEEYLTDIVENKKYIFNDYTGLWLNDDEAKYPDKKIIENIVAVRDKKYYHVGFALEKIHNNNSILLKICAFADYIYLYISFLDNDEEEIMNDSLEQICKDIGFSRVEKKQRYKTIDQNITFYSRYHQTPTYDLFDKNSFNNYVKLVAREVENAMMMIDQNEKKIIQAL